MSLPSRLTRSVGLLTPKSTAFLLCDIQDRFRPIIHECEPLIVTSNFLCNLAKTLDIPIVATEQYPKGLGHTCADVLKGGNGSHLTVPTFEKKLFSMLTPPVQAHLQTLSADKTPPTDYVLFGIESHVCVLQTCLNLLSKGYNVHLVLDAISSQSKLNMEVSVLRMRDAGAFVTTAESLAFMLVESAEHERFKEVSKMVLEMTKEMKNAERAKL